MPPRRQTSAELNIMQILWDDGPASIRELIEKYPGKRQAAYTTVQTLVYRLEKKGALHRTRKIGGAHIFEAADKEFKMPIDIAATRGTGLMSAALIVETC